MTSKQSERSESYEYFPDFSSSTADLKPIFALFDSWLWPIFDRYQKSIIDRNLNPSLRSLLKIFFVDLFHCVLLKNTTKNDDNICQITSFLYATHYSKSQIFVQKFNFDKTQHFHEFFTQFFLPIFLVKSKLSTAKKSKTTTFSRIFHPQKSKIFSGNQSWIFGQKMKISNSVLHSFWYEIK